MSITEQAPASTISLTPSERVVLDVVRRRRPIPRSEIAPLTSLTQSTVHRILDSLARKHLIRFGPLKSDRPGKPTPLVELTDDYAYAIGISVNTDEIRMAIVNLRGEPLGDIIVTDGVADCAASLDRLQDIAAEMTANLGILPHHLISVTLGISGYFLDDGIRISPPLPLADWGLRDLAADLKERFASECYVENSSTASAVGEALLGLGRDLSTFAYLSFNYGFGGGLIVEGEPYRGHHGNAFEISAIYTPEEMSQRPALGLLIRHLHAHGTDVDSVATLRREFSLAWPGVESWIDQVLPQLNRAIWVANALCDPEAIVFGGEIPAELAQAMIDRVSVQPQEVARYGQPPPTARLAIAKAANHGGAVGAASVGLHRRFFATEGAAGALRA